MAKRKRLTPPRSDFLAAAATPNKVGAPPIAQVISDAAETASLHELAAVVDAARAEGRLLQTLPLAEVDAGYLVRDRLIADQAELETLISSIRARGQQTAIEVVDLGPGRPGGRYGLISGWRRLTALRQLHDETGGAEFATVLARITTPTEAPEAYLAMVEENEIRVGLSYYERARIVVRSVEAGVYPDERTALTHLYSAASRAKRSKIKSFITLVRCLDDALRFPAALGERLGLELARRLDNDPAFLPAVAARLNSGNATTAEEEQTLLKAALKAGSETKSTPEKKREESSVQKPLPDVVMEYSSGRLQLRGAGVTQALHDDLLRWLETRGE